MKASLVAILLAGCASPHPPTSPIPPGTTISKPTPRMIFDSKEGLCAGSVAQDGRPACKDPAAAEARAQR